MTPEALVKLAIEALIFLGTAAVTSAVVALIVPHVRRRVRETLLPVVLAGTAGGFLITELWAQFSHRERLANSTLVICVLAAAASTLTTAFLRKPDKASDRLRD